MEKDLHILTKQVGRRIKELRESRNIKQFELAEAIDMEPTNLSKIENGVYFPRENKLKKIAKILDVEIKDLFDVNHIQSSEELMQSILDMLNNSKDKELSFFYQVIKSYKELT